MSRSLARHARTCDPRPLLRYLAVGLAATLGTVACGLAVLPDTADDRLVRTVRAADAAPEFAPYVDSSLHPPFNLVDAAKKTGVKSYTLAFITSGGGCVPKWGGVTDIGANPVANQAGDLRALGGDIRISFGGASGIELAAACPTVTGLTAAYEQVVLAFKLTSADFDIEGAALSDTASNTRR